MLTKTIHHVHARVFYMLNRLQLIKIVFIPQTVLAQLRGSYFFSIVIPLEIAKAGRQVPKPRCLSPAAHSLDIRIAGRQVPEPRCLSPAANSLDIRIAGRQVPKPRCLSPAANSLDSRIAGRQVPGPRYLSLPIRISRSQLSLGT